MVTDQRQAAERADGLAILLEVEARCEASLRARQVEAADLVAAERRAAAARLAESTAELDELASRRRTALAAEAAARLDGIHAGATARVRQLEAVTPVHRLRMVTELVALLLGELTGEVPR